MYWRKRRDHRSGRYLRDLLHSPNNRSRQCCSCWPSQSSWWWKRPCHRPDRDPYTALVGQITDSTDGAGASPWSPASAGHGWNTDLAAVIGVQLVVCVARTVDGTAVGGWLIRAATGAVAGVCRARQPVVAGLAIVDRIVAVVVDTVAYFSRGSRCAAVRETRAGTRALTLAVAIGALGDEPSVSPRQVAGTADHIHAIAVSIARVAIRTIGVGGAGRPAEAPLQFEVAV